MKLLSQHRTFDGEQRRYRHDAKSTNTPMTLSIYFPNKTKDNAAPPVLYWLSGLTCTDENFTQKAGAQRVASELGWVIVAPDTSPRGEQVADDEGYDLGQGAGFYINATQSAWSQHYNMYDYIVEELPALIEAQFEVSDKKAIAGHSMGGHGALMIGLRNPDRYQSISAFSPIVNPMACPWGEKAFQAYLGEDKKCWEAYDSTALMRQFTQDKRPPILIDQGLEDDFLTDQLKPENLIKAAKEIAYPLTYREQSGFDHSYFFIASFIEDHLRFHAAQ